MRKSSLFLVASSVLAVAGYQTISGFINHEEKPKNMAESSRATLREWEEKEAYFEAHPEARIRDKLSENKRTLANIEQELADMESGKKPRLEINVAMDKDMRRLVRQEIARLEDEDAHPEQEWQRRIDVTTKRISELRAEREHWVLAAVELSKPPAQRTREFRYQPDEPEHVEFANQRAEWCAEQIDDATKVLAAANVRLAELRSPEPAALAQK